MYRLRIMSRFIATMRRGSVGALAPAWARYPAFEAARAGGADLLRDDRVLRVLRVMVLRSEIPKALVEWVER